MREKTIVTTIQNKLGTPGMKASPSSHVHITSIQFLENLTKLHSFNYINNITH